MVSYERGAPVPTKVATQLSCTRQGSQSFRTNEPTICAIFLVEEMGNKSIASFRIQEMADAYETGRWKDPTFLPAVIDHTTQK